MTNYGFALRENKYNYARIKIPLGELLNQEQAGAIGKGYSLDLPTVFKMKYSEFCVELLKTIRGLTWNIEKHTSFAFFHPSDFMLEAECLGKMIEALEKIYQNYETRVEEDREILKTATGKLYFAVRII